ncbi:alpha-glucuronidase [Altererythrobacter indicus]|uniref:Alpha-glucuronidase n=1 Tax=Altericroceibacterium indicum TaxID=374177 RepID=A0A845ACH5_9SPHN|nr:alpha-glucuronidase family glycosyl hydrolase [Altericroceibacterium indicum]MXP26256.1 alpha-glucuronidase [Altericroceibacterium indicum]
MIGRKLSELAAQIALAGLALCAFSASAQAEDGYDLWLRYQPLSGASQSLCDPAVDLSGPVAQGVQLQAQRSATVDIAVAELHRGLASLFRCESQKPTILLARTDQLSGKEAQFSEGLRGQMAGSYRLATMADGRILIAANDDIGLLYGSFGLLRHLQTDSANQKLDQLAIPALPLRLLNHWDNPDRGVERGYSGESIFDWWHLPDHLDPRMIDYARANASIGINGTVVNNVNASPIMLTPRYIAKLQRLADAFRPYGIRVYLSVRFSSPRELGGLDSADPLDPKVAAWWKSKADEIYAAIPDFGGFLVKANSEGQPGPQDYGRTHADGANMLATAIGDRGTVIWRAFVYQSSAETDRVKLAYEEFKPLDGKFADNVILQVKNGPLDFQPREPFHPLFGAMPHTRMMLEVQQTKEYLGFATHLAYLGTMWTEVLDANTGHGKNGHLTVADTIVSGGMAGVSNIGSDRNWSGSHFDQANWYAFGRLAWDTSLSADAIAREWAAQTFSRNPQFLNVTVKMMHDSRQAVVDYMTPLGLAHQMATGHHYGPGPWVNDLERPEWNPAYYNRADKSGIGFDRTKNGSDALGQYAPSVASGWSDPHTMDEDYLLWFQHLPWNFRTQSGRTVWEELVARYDRGVAKTHEMQREWAALAPYVDAQRYQDVADDLKVQAREAQWWRDASVSYFASRCECDLPAGATAPPHDLQWYEALNFPDAPGHK